MNTLVYGGAFDPPQQAHEQIAAQLGNTFQPKRLVIVPSGSNRFKSFRAAGEYRLRLADIFVESIRKEFPNAELCDDFLLGRVPETTALSIDGLFRERFGSSPTQVFGLDTVPNMSSWDPSGRVERELPKVFVTRSGYEPDMSRVANYRLFRPDLLDDIAVLSSTMVRANIKDRVFAGLNPEIAECIRTNNLYQ